jgi:hypothetical protein
VLCCAGPQRSEKKKKVYHMVSQAVDEGEGESLTEQPASILSSLTVIQYGGSPEATTVALARISFKQEFLVPLGLHYTSCIHGGMYM